MNGTRGSDVRAFGPVTACRVDIPEGVVRIEGTDDPTARLDVRYLDPGAAVGADPVQDGAVAIEHHGGMLAIRLVEATRSGFLGLLGVSRRPRIALDLRVPRGAGIDANTVGGDVRVVGCGGGQVLSTVTGGATIVEADGDVDVRTVSGPIDIGGDALDVHAATTSGRSRVAGSGIRNLRSRSVSGRIEVAGRLAPGGEHRLESVSGDIELALAGGATVAPRTLSGRLTGDPNVRRDSRDGLPALILGDGRAVVSVKTVSGDIRVSSMATDDRAQASAFPPAAPPSQGPDEMIEALEALARGDISVDEAGRRLESIHG